MRLLVLLLIAISCNMKNKINFAKGENFKKKVNITNDTVNMMFSNQIDSVKVKYWNNFDAKFYIFEISNDYIFSENKQIYSTDTLNLFIDLINKLFIEKSDSIVISKSKSNGIVTDYPIIIVVGYKRGISLFKKVIQIGSEKYKLKFSPEFIKFYELVKEINALCKKQQ